MNMKRSGSGRTSKRKSEEAPELTASWVASADIYRGTKLVRRGRPKLENARRLLSLRLPPDVIAGWKASGPGWQTRMAVLLEKSIRVSRRTAG
jgi:uncharacterized protein (DUF4415 family)